MKINYGLVAYLPYADEDGEIPVLHFCGYENIPTQRDIDSLREELKNDAEFELCKVADDLIIELAHKKITEFYKKVLEE